MSAQLLSSRPPGKVALVTGPGAGIGQGCALVFARHGARVMSCDLDAHKAEAALRAARAEGLAIESLHPCDLTRPADVDRLLAHAVSRFGGPDILVNAAAWGAFRPIMEMDYEGDWRASLTGELDPVFLACKAAWPPKARRTECAPTRSRLGSS